MVMTFYEVMKDLSDAIRSHTGKTGALSLDNQIKDLSSLMDYELNENLDQLTRPQKLTVLADVIRYGLKLTRPLNMYEMPELIRNFGKLAISNGKKLYNNLADAIAECDDGGTVTLLKDVDMGTMSNVSIDKDITLNGNGHTLTREAEGDHLFAIQSSGITFNIDSVIADVNLASGKCFVTADGFSATVNVDDSEIHSSGSVLFFRRSDCNVTVNGSVFEASERTLQFNYCEGSVSVKSSTLTGHDTEAQTILLYYSPVSLFIESSKIYGLSAPALSMRYSDASVTICGDSYLQAENTIYGAVDVQNCSPVIDLKDSTMIWVDSLTWASIRMRGSSSCDPIITLYDNVKLTEGVDGHIYYTRWGERTDFRVRFADSYSGQAFTAMSTWDSTTNCSLRFVNSLTDAPQSYVLLNRDVNYSVSISLETLNLFVKSATVVDAQTGDILDAPRRIYYNGSDAMFDLRYSKYDGYATLIDLTDLYLLADHGTVFYFSEGKIVVHTRDCVIEGKTILNGFTVNEDTFITYDAATRDSLVTEGHHVEEIYDPNSVLYYNVIY